MLMLNVSFEIVSQVCVLSGSCPVLLHPVHFAFLYLLLCHVLGWGDTHESEGLVPVYYYISKPTKHHSKRWHFKMSQSFLDLLT